MTDRNTSQELAEAAGLRYVSDDEPGHRRVRRGKGFSYVDETGAVVGDKDRAWAESLVIPPAWTDVWISTDHRGHILATGYDDAGRKQYIYHPDWEDARDEAKYERLGPFAHRLPRIRRRVGADLKRPGQDRDKVLALAVAVLDRTLIRVGNPQYVESNDSYGLTTLTCDHVNVRGSNVTFAFTGKGGAELEVAFADSRLAKLIAQCRDLKGQTLFSYETDDGLRAVSSTDVNQYLSAVANEPFTAKDFRTWGATTLVAGQLITAPEPDLPADKQFLNAIDVAADRLGNTREISRDSYVHPIVREAWDDGRLEKAWRSSRQSKWLSRPESTVKKLLTGFRSGSGG